MKMNYGYNLTASTVEADEKGELYSNIFNYLVDMYNSKYKLINESSNIKVWKSTDNNGFTKIIDMFYIIYHFDSNDDRIHLQDGKVKVADCLIRIKYWSYDDYIEAIKEREEDWEQLQKEENEEKNSIEKHNNKL